MIAEILPTVEQKTVLQLGDSLTFGAGTTDALRNGATDIYLLGNELNFIPSNFGLSGQTTAQLTAAIPTYFGYVAELPDYALLAIGRNDVDSVTLQADYTDCVNALLTAGCTKIICRGLLPEDYNVFTDENAAIVASVNSFSSEDIIYMDPDTWLGIELSIDGIHPSEAGYVTIAGYEDEPLLAIIGNTVTYDANGGTGGAVPTDTTDYESGATVTAAGNTGNLTRAGFNFGGWNTSADGSGTHYDAGDTFGITDDVILYAVWVAIIYHNVTYLASDATGGAVPVDSTDYEEGSTVTVAENPGSLERTGYAFAGWSLTEGGEAVVSFAILADTNLFALWTVVDIYRISDVTRDKEGNPLGGVQVSLFEAIGSGVYIYRQTTVSNATTGAYSFEVTADTDYMITARITGTPNRFDCTDSNLRGVLV